jgi:choline transport protein
MDSSKNSRQLEVLTAHDESLQKSGRQSRGTQLSDDQTLRRLGKTPVLKRNFGFMSILGFSCTVLISWESILITSIQGLLNGGPAGIIWGFLVCWIGTLSTFTVIAEVASMAPTSGGQCKSL